MQLIAYVTMFIDHICKFAIPDFVYNPLLGRLAMPIFAYLIATGMKRTKNQYKYIFRLFIFAIISQIPYILMIRGSGVFDYTTGNIIEILNHYTSGFNIGFTFLIATLSIFFIDKNKNNFLNIFIIVIISLFVANELNTDYSIYGVITIYIFYFLKDRKAIFFSYFFITTFYIFNDSIKPDFSLDPFVKIKLRAYASLLALPIIFWMKENKPRNSKVLQIIKYAIYPVHMLIIYLVTIF